MNEMNENNKKVIQKIIELFHDNRFGVIDTLQTHNINEEYFQWKQILNLWKFSYSKEEYKKRNENNKNLNINYAFIKRNNKNISDEEAFQLAFQKVKRLNKMSNENKCMFCNERVTEKNWINHYKNCKLANEYNFFEKQLRLAIQLFDNLDLITEEEHYQFGMRCNNRILKNIWKKYIGEKQFKERLNIFTGRRSAIKRYGKIDSEYIEWNTTNDDNLTLNELIKKHTYIIEAFKHEKEARKHFKITLGHIVPRIDITNSEGFRSSWEANIARIFNYNNKRYKNEISFRIPDLKKETKRGYKEYIVDFCDIDNMFGFGENTFIEVKGIFDEKAKHKKEMFEKNYPDKKLIFIGVTDAENNFYPEIDYEELSKKYRKLIPMWEVKYNSAFSHPEKFLPKDFLKKIRR